MRRSRRLGHDGLTTTAFNSIVERLLDAANKIASPPVRRRNFGGADGYREIQDFVVDDNIVLGDLSAHARRKYVCTVTRRFGQDCHEAIGRQTAEAVTMAHDQDAIAGEHLDQRVGGDRAPIRKN